MGGLTKPFHYLVKEIDQFWYIKIQAWLRGLGEWNNRNYIEVPWWIINLFRFIPLNFAAKQEF